MLEMKSRIQILEQRDREQTSRIQNLELQVEGRQLVQSVFEYSKFLEECTVRRIKKSNLLIRGNRFGALYVQN